MRVRVSIALAALCLAACRQDMHDQPRFEAFEGSSARAQVPETIARGQLREDHLLYEGKEEKQQQQASPFLFPVTDVELEQALAGLASEEFAERFPFPVARAVMDRGRDRYTIFCSPCHGAAGDGRGVVVDRGFRGPPSYTDDRLRAAPAGHFFDVITRGVGAMEDFSDRIPARDRWAIVAYIRALQAGGHASADELPADIDATSLPEIEAVAAPAAPSLLTDPAGQLGAYLARQEERLNSYGWVDRERGIVRIPIDRAIELLLDRGLPAREAAEGE